MEPLPSINDKFSNHPAMLKADVPNTRPTSSVATGRRTLGMPPKSAGATSKIRRSRHSEVAMTSNWQPNENQIQRPSSTNVASRAGSNERMAVRVLARHADKLEYQQQEERFTVNEPEEGDSRSEIQQLREENARFRHDIDLLRSMLVEKIRGQSKVVAGGQFRAAFASPVAKVPTGCTKCSTARAKAFKAHQESKEAQVATAELREYVDKIEAAQQRLWEERSAHVNEIAQLRDKLAEKVEECVLFEAECTKLDRQVKKLQPENDFAVLLTRPLEEVVDNETQCDLERSCDDEVKASQLREISTLRAEVQLLTQQLDERQQDLQRVLNDLEEAQKAAKQDEEHRERESRMWLDDCSKHQRRILEFEQSEKKLQVFIQNLEDAHQNELNLLLETKQGLEKGVKVLEQRHQDEMQRHEILVHALKVRIEQKIADIDRLHALMSAETASKSVMKKKIERLEDQIQTMSEENTQLAADKALQQQQAENFAKVECDKLKEEATKHQNKLKATEQANQALQSRVSEVEAEIADQVSIMQKLKRSHARSLERLLESSLRLCVVAPTVNVQLNTNTTSKTKVLSDKDSSELMSVKCRSTPQHESIKRVIENDVLPLFTSVFVQGDDNASPQAQVPMTRWLQDLLHDMQARIAAQLESIYSTASVKSNE